MLVRRNIIARSKFLFIPFFHALNFTIQKDIDYFFALSVQVSSVRYFLKFESPVFLWGLFTFRVKFAALYASLFSSSLVGFVIFWRIFQLNSLLTPKNPGTYYPNCIVICSLLMRSIVGFSFCQLKSRLIWALSNVGGTTFKS